MKRKKNPAIAQILARQFQDRNAPADSQTGIASVHTIGYHGEEHKDKVALFGLTVKQKAEARTSGGLHSLMKVKAPHTERFTLIRLSPDLFHEGLRHGVSLQQRFAERMQLTGLREVEVEFLDHYEPMRRVEIAIRGRFLSKREIWNFHRHLLDLVSNNRAPVLHLNSPPPESKFLYRAKVSHIENGDDSVKTSAQFGLMGTETQIRIRSKSTHMILLLEISSELFYYSLSGEPYYERAIAFIREFLEKLYEEDRSETYAHDFTIILFGRSRQCSEDVDRYSDWYDVLWEGPSRALPSALEVATHIRNRIAFPQNRPPQNEGGASCGCSYVGGSSSSYFCPSNYSSCQDGPSIEAIHLALNNIDSHHIERRLHITGHTIMLITANNGVVTCNNKRLWEMTQIRFKSTGVNCIMVCLREAPLHEVPLAILGSQDDDSLSTQAKTSAEFLHIVFYPEAMCLTGWRPRSSLLPLERVIPNKNFVPYWTKDVCDLRAPDDIVLELKEELGDVKTCPPHSVVSLSRDAENHSFDSLDPWTEDGRIRKMESTAGSLHWRDRLGSGNSAQQSSVQFPQIEVISRKKNAPMDLDFESISAPILLPVFVDQAQNFRELVSRDWNVRNERSTGDLENTAVQLLHDLVGVRLITDMQLGIGVGNENPLQTHSEVKRYVMHSDDAHWVLVVQDGMIVVSQHDKTPERGLRWHKSKYLSVKSEELCASLPSVPSCPSSPPNSRLRSPMLGIAPLGNKMHQQNSNSSNAICRPDPVPFCKPLSQSTGNIAGLQQRADKNSAPWRLPDSLATVSMENVPTFGGQVGQPLPLADADLPEMMDSVSEGSPSRSHPSITPEGSKCQSHLETVTAGCLRYVYLLRRRPLDWVEHHEPDDNQECSFCCTLDRAGWVSSQRLLYACQKLPWNTMDRFVGGDISAMPKSEPYREEDYQLRNALRTFTLVLIPEFEVPEPPEPDIKAVGSSLFVDPPPDVMERFLSWKKAFENLCVGAAPEAIRNAAFKMDMSQSTHTERIEAQWMLDNQSAHSNKCHGSRDFLHLTLDTAFRLPCYRMSLEWIVCSSLTLWNFLEHFLTLAREHAFACIRTSHGQLFPRPVPETLRGGVSERETNFRRHSFHPRISLELPPVRLDFYKLLITRLQNEMRLIVTHCVKPLLASVTVDVEENFQERVPGWTLMHPLGHFFVQIHEYHVHWMDNFVTPIAPTMDITKPNKLAKFIADRQACCQKSFATYKRIVHECSMMMTEKKRE